MGETCTQVDEYKLQMCQIDSRLQCFLFPQNISRFNFCSSSEIYHMYLDFPHELTFKISAGWLNPPFSYPEPDRLCFLFVFSLLIVESTLWLPPHLPSFLLFISEKSQRRVLLFKNTCAKPDPSQLKQHESKASPHSSVK